MADFATTFPDTPSRQRSATYSTDKDAFLAATPARVAELEGFAVYVDDRGTDASGVTLWVAGTAYNNGDVVKSPADKLTYRATVDQATSTTDPSSDGGNWEIAGGLDAVNQAKLNFLTLTQAVNLDDVASGHQYTAEGEITAGETVVLKAATGKVSAVSSTTGSTVYGTHDEVYSTATSFHGKQVCAIGNGKFGFVYNGASNYIRIVIGDISGGTWIFGTPVIIESEAAAECSIDYDSTSDRVVTCYRLTSGSNLIAHTFSVSGNTPTAKAAKTTIKTSVNAVKSPLVCGNGYAFFAYEDSSLQAICATIGDASLTLGSEITMNGTGTEASPVSVAYNPEDDVFLISYYEQTNFDAYAIIVSHSGNTLTDGTPYNIGPSSRIAIEYLSTGKAIVTYQDDADASKGKIRIVHYSGTTISSLGVATELSGMDMIIVPVDTIVRVSEALVMVGGIGASDYPTVWECSISSDVFTEDNATVFQSVDSEPCGVAYDTAGNNMAFCWNDKSGSDYLRVVDIQPAPIATDADDWIGIAQATVAETEAVSVKKAGQVDACQTGLTIGTTYYIDNDGSLTANTSGGRKIGRALSATELYITEAA